MERNINISIIIPVFKVEKYLHSCIESVINQAYKDIEIILVDDGSPDNCGKICDEYACKDSRIKVIHKKNEGVSIARNVGIDSASGKYIMFLDSDDLLMEDILTTISRDIVEGVELYTYAHKKIDENGLDVFNMNTNLENGVYEKHTFLKEYYKKNGTLPWAVWQHVFKSNIIKEKNIKFPAGIRAAEDLDFYMKYMEYVDTIKVSDFEIINYRVNREGSVMTEMKLLTYLDILKIYKKYSQYNDKLISKIFSTLYLSLFFNIAKIKKEDRKVALENYDLKAIGTVEGIKNKRNKMVLNIFGKNNTFKILELKLKHRR